MATMIVCPRCRGAVQPDAQACPRCGLALDGLVPQESVASRAAYDQRPVADASRGEYLANGGPGAPTMASTSPYSPASPEPLSGLPVRQGAQNMAYMTQSSGTAVAAMPAAPTPVAAARIVPRGAIELLADENVVFQLGALYLTNKRVILLAPSVVRAAFLRDVDAVGTLTERSSGWTLFFGLVFLVLAAAGIYFTMARRQFEASLPLLYVVEPVFIGLGLGVLGLVLLVMYFLWVKRTLFVSVSGRPLITVSVSDWNARKLEGMDTFVNSFFQVKDASR